MSEWSTVRVRTELLERVKARAEGEGSRTTPWVERALGAALADGAQGDPATVAVSFAHETKATSRRAPVPQRSEALKRQDRLNKAKGL